MKSYVGTSGPEVTDLQSIMAETGRLLRKWRAQCVISAELWPHSGAKWYTRSEIDAVVTLIYRDSEGQGFDFQVGDNSSTSGQGT